MQIVKHAKQTLDLNQDGKQVLGSHEPLRTRNLVIERFQLFTSDIGNWRALLTQVEPRRPHLLLLVPISSQGTP